MSGGGAGDAEGNATASGGPGGLRLVAGHGGRPEQGQGWPHTKQEAPEIVRNAIHLLATLVSSSLHFIHCVY